MINSSCHIDKFMAPGFYTLSYVFSIIIFSILVTHQLSGIVRFSNIDWRTRRTVKHVLFYHIKPAAQRRFFSVYLMICFCLLMKINDEKRKDDDYRTPLGSTKHYAFFCNVIKKELRSITLHRECLVKENMSPWPYPSLEFWVLLRNSVGIIKA